jgi:hypothetical protein
VFGSHFRPVVQITARTSSGHGAETLSAAGSILAAGGSRQSSSLGGGGERSGVGALPAALAVDADGFVAATYVHYEQLAQPKGGCLYAYCVAARIVTGFWSRVNTQQLTNPECCNGTILGVTFPLCSRGYKLYKRA